MTNYFLFLKKKNDQTYVAISSTNINVDVNKDTYENSLQRYISIKLILLQPK
jgi:hypothetical protein